MSSLDVGSNPTKTTCEEERAFLEPLEDVDVVRQLQELACRSSSPELLLWLKRADVYDPMHNKPDVVLSVVNLECLELLMEDGVNCNVIDDDALCNLAFRHDRVCALNKARNRGFVRTLFRGGFNLQTLKLAKFLSPRQLRWVLQERCADFMAAFSVPDV